MTPDAETRPSRPTRGAAPWGVRIELPRRGSTERRRLGLVLTAFGGTGLLLFGIALAFVAAPVGDDGPLGLEAQRRQLVAMLDASSAAIADAETAAANVDVSLTSTASAAGSAGTFMGELATTMRALAGSLRVSLLGSQPFEGAADDFERVADRASSVAEDLGRASGSVGLAAEDIKALSRDLGLMRIELDRIRGSIAGPIEIRGWRLLIGAMLAWLAIPAAVSLGLGLRWLNPGPIPR